MLTIDSDRDIWAHFCSNNVGNLATVDKHSSSCHCSVPYSCTAAVTDHYIVLIQVISEFHGVGICGRTVENDVCTFADCIFTYLQLDSLWWIWQRWKLSQYSCHHNKLALVSVYQTWWSEPSFKNPESSFESRGTWAKENITVVLKVAEFVSINFQCCWFQIICFPLWLPCMHIHSQNLHENAAIIIDFYLYYHYWPAMPCFQVYVEFISSWAMYSIKKLFILPKSPQV